MPRPSSVLVTISLAVLASSSLACATAGDSLSDQPASAEPEATKPQPSTDADHTLADLERRLLGASEVEIAFVIESDGAYVSQLEGTLHWTKDAEFVLNATGEFGARRSSSSGAPTRPRSRPRSPVSRAGPALARPRWSRRS